MLPQIITLFHNTTPQNNISMTWLIIIKSTVFWTSKKEHKLDFSVCKMNPEIWYQGENYSWKGSFQDSLSKDNFFWCLFIFLEGWRGRKRGKEKES